MPATLYQSSDTGAPNLGSSFYLAQWITLLDACLVNGYGSKAGAGWTKEFSDGTNVVYRNGATAKARSYFRFTSSPDYRIYGYDTMTGPSTGTGIFPSTVYSGTVYIPGSLTDLVSWSVVADSRTALVILRRSNNSRNLSICFGDFSPLLASDNGCALVFCGINSPANGSQWYGTTFVWGTALPASEFFSIKGKPSYDGADTNGFFLPNPCMEIGQAGRYAVQNTATGEMFLSPILIGSSDDKYGNGSIIRGRMRFVYAASCQPSNYVDGSEVAGVGEFSGRTFKMFRVTVAQSAGNWDKFIAVDLNDPD